MVHIIGDLTVAEQILILGLAVVREIEEVDHVVLLLENGLPVEVHDALETEHLMVLLPAVADEDRVCLGQWTRLEVCNEESSRSSHEITLLIIVLRFSDSFSLHGSC